jgi:MerR family transcriptional regulator, heat shock protein HspR
MRRKKGFFSISAVSQMFSIHPQTIRLYEQEGLITPKRSEGNTRLFSEEDVNKLEEIVYLTHHVGVNLAGVEMILKLKRQISKLQKELNAAFNAASEELSKQEIASKHAIRTGVNRVMALKEKSQKKKPKPALPALTEKQQDSAQLTLEHIGDWEVDYDDEN